MIERERDSGTPGVVWTLDHFSGDAYILRNAGRAPAYDVRITTGDLIGRGELEHQEVEPDDQIKLVLVRSMATADDTITVSWAEQPSGLRKEWRRYVAPRSQAGTAGSDARR